jgi:hypothetical protein
MTINVVSEIVAIRERVARMESTLEEIRRVMQKQPTSSGSIVVPVAVITALIQGGVALAQHFV